MEDATRGDDAGPVVQSDTGRFAMIPEWVLDLHLPCSTVAVYAALALHADRRTHDGIPSRKTLAEFTGCSVDTVDRAIKMLGGVGALAVQPRRREDGSATSNRYILLRAKPASRRGVAAPTRPGVAAPVRYQEQSHSEQRMIPTASRTADIDCIRCHGSGLLISPTPGANGEPFAMPCPCTAEDYEPAPPAATRPPSDFGMPANRGATA